MAEKVRKLPVGAEFEYEAPMSLRSSSTNVSVFRYRVTGHSCVEPHGIAESIDAIGGRTRICRALRAEGRDAFGSVIWRADLDGEPANPTYAEVLEREGVEMELS